MDRGWTKTVGLAAITALLAVFVARADGSPVRQAAGTVAADSASRDSLAQPRWINDAGILSLLGVMNARHVAAASAELQAWRSDTVRALATSLAHDHAALQHTADSVASAIHVTPVAPALADSVNATMQMFVDSIAGNRGEQLDRTYVRMQLASHQLMAQYIDELSTFAEHPEVKALLDAAATRVGSEIARVQTVQASFVARDSIVSDSIAKRSAERTGRRKNSAGTNR